MSIGSELDCVGCPVKRRERDGKEEREKERRV